MLIWGFWSILLQNGAQAWLPSGKAPAGIERGMFKSEYSLGCIGLMVRYPIFVLFFSAVSIWKKRGAV